MMETIITFASIAQIIAISLGVGSSTLAVLNFFSAILDGTIDATERRMMGVTYLVLRISMVLIFCTIGVLAAMGYTTMGTAYFTPYVIAQISVVAILFLNAFLMTARIMPSTFGPAIQAGSWYLLGFGLALASLNLADFSLVTFVVAYALEIAFATFVINITMHHIKKRNQPTAAV
jgi:hypothetical protein